MMEIRRDSALTNWRRAEGVEELVKWQALYNEAQAVIDLVRVAPVQFNKTGG